MPAQRKKDWREAERPSAPGTAMQSQQFPQSDVGPGVRRGSEAVKGENCTVARRVRSAPDLAPFGVCATMRLGIAEDMLLSEPGSGQLHLYTFASVQMIRNLLVGCALRVAHSHSTMLKRDEHSS